MRVVRRLSVAVACFWAFATVHSMAGANSSPASMSLQPGASRQSAAKAGGAKDERVTWPVDGLYAAASDASSPTPIPVALLAGSSADNPRIVQPIDRGHVRVSVFPVSVTLYPGQIQVFTATVTGSRNTAVIWRVNGLDGGSSTVGTIAPAGVRTAPVTPAANIAARSRTNPAAGAIPASGLYTAPAAVPSAFSVTVTAASVADATQSASATVALTPLTPLVITTSTLPDGTVATPYAASLAVTGGVGPYVWSLSSGQLAPGLSLASSGAVSGTPSTSGTYTAVVQVKDAARQQVSKTFSMAIAAALILTTASLPNGVAGTPYSATLSATGGTAPYAWSVVSGSLPAGVALAGGGTLAGTPSTAGSYSFTVQVQDAAGRRASRAFDVSVAVPVTVRVAPATVSLFAGQTQQFTAAVTGTTNTGVTWSISPAVGTISGAGLYTAPISVGSPQTVAVTATSVADPSNSASAVVGISPATTAAKTGGLLSLPTPVPSDNLLGNPGFESWTGGAPNDWAVHATGVTRDTSVYHSGASSMKITNPNANDYVVQSLSALPAGTYTFTAWIKYTSFSPSGGGMRICVEAPALWPYNAIQCTATTYSGTSDWVQITIPTIIMPTNTGAGVMFQVYDSSALTTGTFWADDVVLSQNLYPVQAFMLYPNYHGFLFSDWSQGLQFDVAVTPPDGTLSDYLTKYTVVDETTSNPVASASSASVADTTISIWAGGWPQGHSFTVTFELDLASNGSTVYTYPAYRVLTKSGTDRASMVVVVDPNNRILLNGTPTFLIGAYTSGMSYSGTVAFWQTQYTTDFRFSEFAAVGGNMNNPYTIGNAPNSAILPMYQYLQGLSTPVWSTYAMNCSGNATTTASEPWWFTTQWPNWPSGEIPARVSAQGFLGFYLADECNPGTVSDAFTWASRTAMAAPDRINTGVLGLPGDALVWRDVLDVFGIDPYYIDGPSGYPLGNTWRDIAQANANLHGARPILGTMQYYQRSGSRWPTQDDLRSVSYMAIVGGANALTYWSLGINGLLYICDGSDAYHSPKGAATWCQAAVDEYSYLKNVVSELSGLQSVLSNLDDPSRLAVNSQPDAIKTRIKVSPGGKRYLITVNVTANTVSPTFTWASNIEGTVAVYHESRSITPGNSTAFTDAFGPYAAHVYILF